MLSQFSRYLYNLEYEDGNGAHWLGEPEPFAYSNETDNRVHVAREGDTWWGLAYVYFPSFPRAGGLWWILCDYQPEQVVDPTIAITPGRTLVIPSERVVRSKIFNPERRSEH